MTSTYLFYDIETTGLNKCFDQILQFAAIRTDTEFNELERHEFLVQLNIDVIPHPAAIITHRISIAQANTGISEIEAVKKIHALLNQPGTISIGYNTLGFDDEFLRFSFYRNLLPPYTHQFANQCGRMDLYPITVLYFLYKPEALSWPIINEKPSLKLENLNASNQLADGNAHNAMVDVEVTLQLARRLSKYNEMWHYASSYFDKKTDQERASQLPTSVDIYQEGILIDGGFGPGLFYQHAALNLGVHNHYKNQTLWLHLDQPNLNQTTEETIASNTWISRKKFGEPGLLLPPNNRFQKYIDHERQALIADNKHWLQKNLTLLKSISHYHKEYKYPKVSHLDIDAALYEMDFLTPLEQKLNATFHRVSPKEKAALINQFNKSYLREQALRIMGRHFRDFMPDNLLEEFESYLKRINPKSNEPPLVNYRGEARLTPQQALAEIANIRVSKKLDLEQEKLLAELEQYLRSLSKT